MRSATRATTLNARVRLKGRAAALAVVLMLALGAVASPAPLTLLLNDGKHLILAGGSDKPTAWLNSPASRTPLVMDAPLLERLTEAQAMVFLHDAGRRHDHAASITLLVRVPSNPSTPMGYCGAGHEDSLLLIEVHDQRLRLLDQMLLQSCLKTITLASSSGDHLGEALTPMAHPWVASFQREADDAEQRYCIRVQGRRLVMENCPAMPNVRPPASAPHPHHAAVPVG